MNAKTDLPEKLTLGPTLVTPSIRPFEDDDYPAVVAVSNAVYHEYPFSVESARHEDSRYDGTRLHLRRFVAEVDGRIVADAEFHHVSNMYHPQKFWVDLSVHPGHQGQGIGRTLYENLLRELTPYRPLTLWTGVRETFDRSIAFAAHRGFREIRRAWESRLDVTHFDPSPPSRPAIRSRCRSSTTCTTRLPRTCHSRNRTRR